MNRERKSNSLFSRGCSISLVSVAASSIYNECSRARCLESLSKTRAKSGNWLSTDIRPMYYYTAQGCVTYWSWMGMSCIGIEGYTGQVTRPVYFVSSSVLWISSGRMLHGSVVVLTQPMYFVSTTLLNPSTFPSFLPHFYVLGLHQNPEKYSKSQINANAENFSI